MTSSPGSMPRAWSAITSASVPFATPMPWAAPTRPARSLSASRTSGPRMKRPESTTSPMRALTRSATSAHWAEGFMRGTDMCPTVAIRPPRAVRALDGLHDRDAPRRAACEERVGIDLAEPSEEVALGVVVGRAEDGVARAPRRQHRLIGVALLERRPLRVPLAHIGTVPRWRPSSRGAWPSREGRSPIGSTDPARARCSACTVDRAFRARRSTRSPTSPRTICASSSTTSSAVASPRRPTIRPCGRSSASCARSSRCARPSTSVASTCSGTASAACWRRSGRSHTRRSCAR